MFRLISSNKRAIGLAIRPNLRAGVPSIASGAWRRQANAICAAVPQSKSFSSMMLKGGLSKRDEEEQRSVPSRKMSTAVATEDQPESFMGVVRQYGLLPLVGLAGVAALSKEVYFLGAETLLFGNFVLTFFCGYVVAGEAATKYFQGEKAAFQGKIDDIIDLQTAFWDSLANEYNSRLGFATYLQHVKKNEIESMRLINEAQGFQDRHAAHAETLRKLRGIAHDEFEARMAASAQVSIEAANYATSNFIKSDAKLKAQVIDNAIADLGKADVTRAIDQDPIKQLFMEYFEKQQKA